MGSQHISCFSGFFGLVYFANVTLVCDHADITASRWALCVLRPLGEISIFVEYERLIDGVVDDYRLVSEVALPALDGDHLVFLLVLLLVTLALEIVSILAIQLGLFIDGSVLVRQVRLLAGALAALLRGGVLNGQISGVDVLLQHLQLAWRRVRQSVVQDRRRRVNFDGYPLV